MSEVNLSVESRVHGCLLGGAIGDAFGYKVEFKSLNSIRMSYGEAGIQEPEETDGQFVVSDDTQMTLFTLEGLIRGLGGTEETILEEILPLLGESYRGEETIVALLKVLELTRSEQNTTECVRELGEGWVGEEALAIGIYAALRASSFEEALIIAANHDGDSDSTASIAGQVYGAWHGEEVIPKAWIEKLDIVKVMEKLVVEFMVAKGGADTG